jgi:hypothetical protein
MAGVAGDRGRGAGQAVRQVCQGLNPAGTGLASRRGRHAVSPMPACVVLCPVGAFRAAGARVTGSVLSGRPR